MDTRRRISFNMNTGGGQPSEPSTGGTYTVNLNNAWQLSTTITNPDSTLYDGVYQSYANKGVHNSGDIMYIDIEGLESFKLYIRSYAESSWDYIMVSQLDKTLTYNSLYSDTSLVKAHTRGNQNSGTSINNYTLVEFTGIDGGKHRISIIYRKDGSSNSGDDRGYVLIPKSNGSSGSGDTSGPINTSDYMTILALENGLTASLSTNACQYCVDGDGNWIDLPAGTTTQSINSGQTLSFKGNLTPNSSSGIGTFSISKKCNLEGNCMSLLFGDNAVNNNSLSGKSYAFRYLFRGCTTIIQVSETFLPATTLNMYCYTSMFEGCTSLTTAPELPATTLASYCYDSMFYRCTSLTVAPELPVNYMRRGCYRKMFFGCVNLTTPPKKLGISIEVNDIVDCNTCVSMFEGCSSLTTAPELPATTLASYCYDSMFKGCTSLTAAPKLPATVLAEHCYSNMFYGCTSLTAVPSILPATTLVDYCYQYMFRGCSSLTSAPKLPATTLVDYCYEYMFQGCTSLTTAPELPATTLVSSCYQRMFINCINLNYIKMLATDISATNCLYYWVYNVSGTGTFVKNPAMTSLPTGISGIPGG